MKKTLEPMLAECGNQSDLDQLLGERRAFSRMADSCSAADAECLRHMRDKRMYLSKQMNWAQFCTQYLDISKAEANRIIHRFEEFGQSYFDLSRIVRISPESYRAIAHAVKDQAIEWNGETIPLTPANKDRVAAAVQALRPPAAPQPKPVKPAIAPAAPVSVSQETTLRIHDLDKRAHEIVKELRRICGSATCESQHRLLLQSIAREMRGRMFDLEIAAA